MRTNFSMQYSEYITMVKGDTLSFGLEIKDQYGNMIDVDEAYMSCKKNLTDENEVFQKTLGDGITRQEAGKYVVRVDPEDTQDVEIGMYFYDFQIVKNGDVFTLMRGYLKIDWEVTDKKEV